HRRGRAFGDGPRHRTRARGAHEPRSAPLREVVTSSRYLLRRLLQMVPVLFGILLLNFCLIHLAPGDPVQILAGDFAPPPESAARLRAEFGLDRPLWVQATIYFGRLL